MATQDRLLKRKPKKRGKGRVGTVLQEQATIEAVCLAELGKCNDVIRKQFNVDLSDGQFQYRLTKAKNAAGFAKGDGFRKAWREGRSTYEEIIVNSVLPQLREDYEKNILPKAQKPPARVSPIQPEP